MLGAVDDRLAAQAPVVMVSHTMQGGCLCENAPGLRVQLSNMELAAAAAPRPQILVAAAGDWTKDTLTVEGPAIANIYRLLDALDRFHFVRFDFGHNYNQTSREAVYQWFGQWLLKDPNPAVLREAPYQKESDEALRVFPDHHLPAGALTQRQLIDSLKDLHRKEWQALVPHSRSGLKKYQQVMRPAWEHTLELESPQDQPLVRLGDWKVAGNRKTAALKIQRVGGDTGIEATYWKPLQSHSQTVVVLCRADQDTTPSAENPVPGALCQELLQRGLAVLAIDRFTSGDWHDQFADFYSTYNRTKLQQRVQDLVTACQAAKVADPRESRRLKVILCGIGQAGPWALMAAPAADAVVADVEAAKTMDEATLLGPDLFCPGILSLGGFEGAALLAAPHPLLLHHAATNFPTKNLAATYGAVAPRGNLRLDSALLPDAEIANWIARF